MKTNDLKNSKTADESIEVEAAPDAQPDQMKRLVTLGTAQLTLRTEIMALESVLAAKQKELKTNVEADLPHAMSEAGIDKFTLSGGIDVKLKKIVSASIPKSNPGPGLDWMDEVAPDLVKRKITLEFGREDEKFFNKFIADMRKRKRQPVMKYDRLVEVQTLGKFVRDRDKAGLGVPEKDLGVYRVTRAIVDVPTPEEQKDQI